MQSYSIITLEKLINILTKMHELVFLETFLLTEILELSLVTYRGQEALPAADVLLTITAHLETLLVILQTHVGAKLFDVTTESEFIMNNFTSPLTCIMLNT